jgi:hypothetical protein
MSTLRLAQSKEPHVGNAFGNLAQVSEIESSMPTQPKASRKRHNISSTPYFSPQFQSRPTKPHDKTVKQRFLIRDYFKLLDLRLPSP